MHRRKLPRAARRRLLLLLVVGGVIGAMAAEVPNLGARLCLVGVAVVIGVYAGVITHRSLRTAGPE